MNASGSSTALTLSPRPLWLTRATVTGALPSGECDTPPPKNVQRGSVHNRRATSSVLPVAAAKNGFFAVASLPFASTCPHRYRDPNPDTNAKTFCVLTPALQLSNALQTCLMPCSSALVCSNVAATQQQGINGTPLPASAACGQLIDATFDGFITQIIRGGFEGTLRDHAAYMGVDVDNELCRADNSIFTAYRSSC